MAVLDDMLGKVTIDNAELAIDRRVAVVAFFDDGGLEVAWARENRTQVLLGKAADLRVGAP